MYTPTPSLDKVHPADQNPGFFLFVITENAAFKSPGGDGACLSFTSKISISVELIRCINGKTRAKHTEGNLCASIITLTHVVSALSPKRCFGSRMPPCLLWYSQQALNAAQKGIQIMRCLPPLLQAVGPKTRRYYALLKLLQERSNVSLCGWRAGRGVIIVGQETEEYLGQRGVTRTYC